MPTVTTDIRGVPRPVDGAYDIGAYEGAGGPATGTPPVTPLPPYTPPAGSGSVTTRPAASIPLIPCTPQTLMASPSPNAGCNQGGVGWIPSYLGVSGNVPVGDDPIDGERLTGKRSIYLYAEMTHRKYI